MPKRIEKPAKYFCSLLLIFNCINFLDASWKSKIAQAPTAQKPHLTTYEMSVKNLQYLKKLLEVKSKETSKIMPYF